VSVYQLINGLHYLTVTVCLCVYSQCDVLPVSCSCCANNKSKYWAVIQSGTEGVSVVIQLCLVFYEANFLLLQLVY